MSTYNQTYPGEEVMSQCRCRMQDYRNKNDFSESSKAEHDHHLSAPFFDSEVQADHPEPSLETHTSSKGSMRPATKLSLLNEIIKYKNFSRGFASKTFSKKSCSSYGLDDNTTNISSLSSAANFHASKLNANKSQAAPQDLLGKESSENSLVQSNKKTEFALEQFSAASFAALEADQASYKSSECHSKKVG